MVERRASSLVVEADIVPIAVQRRDSFMLVEIDGVPPVQRRTGFMLVEVDIVLPIGSDFAISGGGTLTFAGAAAEETSGSFSISGGGGITLAGVQPSPPPPKGIDAQSAPPLRARRIPPGSLWASDARISQPQPVHPRKPILKEFGGFGFTADGLRHSLTQADKEQMFEPLYSPEGQGPDTDTVADSEEEQ